MVGADGGLLSPRLCLVTWRVCRGGSVYTTAVGRRSETPLPTYWGVQQPPTHTCGTGTESGVFQLCLEALSQTLPCTSQTAEM